MTEHNLYQADSIINWQGELQLMRHGYWKIEKNIH